MNEREPSYLALHRSGQLRRRGERLWQLMDRCVLCPRRCEADRLSEERGFCGADAHLEIAACHPHFGEETPLVGTHGSGTIFFTHCSLRCVFCINHEISKGGEGRQISVAGLADMMLRLQDRGCHNLNIVTPTHYAPHLLLALDVAAGKGFGLPLVYNTSGWELPEILEALDGVVDIYLADFKYFVSEAAARYSEGAVSYPEVTMVALKEMHRQVGVAKPDPDGLIRHGLMIRHLVMPDDQAGTRSAAHWIAGNLSPDTWVTLMSQFQPRQKTAAFPELSRRLTRVEYAEAVGWAREAGLTNVDLQLAPI